jgi:hypothetical protein
LHINLPFEDLYTSIHDEVNVNALASGCVLKRERFGASGNIVTILNFKNKLTPSIDDWYGLDTP